ncbi:MAG: hypothetical protein EPN88_10865 [Bacteroidetes bacterium]|nr:MAG: hypothetical protein EPN88_10865 [Bacteroidota bacterium]
MDFKPFIEYYNKHIKGDEKGEAQIFLDRFFNALGYDSGLKGAGASCEFRISDEDKGSTKFADLIWKPIVLIEMKKRDSDLSLHYQQAFDYWTKLVPNRPQYVILCNFDDFWIYNLNEQVYHPLEKININDLQDRQEAFGFLLPSPRKPIFNYNREDITEKAAKCISYFYNSIKKREKPEIALKYCLQIVLTLFAEDIDLYRITEKPGKNPIKDIQHELDNNVIDVYGFDSKSDLLQQLLDLNLELAQKEEKGEIIQGPGLPYADCNHNLVYSNDCI